MVKVTGPMMSLTARGSLAKTITFSIWKGKPYVRVLVTPVNPQTADQGNRRVMLGGLGRAPKYVQPTKVFETFAKEVAPAGQSWISYFVAYIAKTYFPDVAGYDAVFAAFQAHGAAADFNTQALALGLTEFNLAYKGMGNSFPASFQLYCLALYATDQYLLDNTKFNAAPYTVALASWVEAQILLMVADFSA